MKRCLFLTVLLGLCGCASVPPLDLAPDIRATLGTVGLMARDTPPELDYSTPTTGAASGAWNALKLWEEMSRGRLYYGGLLFLPLFGIGGAMIGGAVPSETADAVASAATNLREAWAGMKVSEGIRDLVFQHARDRTRHTVRLLPAPDPPEHDAASGRAALAEQGVTTVLEVRVPQVALVADRAGHNPPMHLLVTADATLTRTHDGEVLYALSLERRSIRFEFVAWGANNAQEFRYQLAMLTASLAHDISLKVFTIDLRRFREGPAADPTGKTEAAETENSDKDQSKPQE